MKKPLSIFVVLCIFVSPTVFAGVVMDMVTQDAAGNETDRTKFSVQGGKVRMDEQGGSNSMIFLGTEFIMLDHKDMTYIVMDEAMLDKMGSQMNAAMEQMQQQLASMPPEQRAMMEQMMQGGMQGMMPGMKPPPPPPRVERSGAGKWRDYSCRKYSIYEGAELTEDICAAPLNDVEGSDEIIAGFRSMAVFIQKMMDSMPEPIASAMGNNPASFMEEIEGFPVHTVHYRDGAVSEQSWLESVTEAVVTAEAFTVPTNYRKEDPFRGR